MLFLILNPWTISVVWGRTCRCKCWINFRCVIIISTVSSPLFYVVFNRHWASNCFLVWQFGIIFICCILIRAAHIIWWWEKEFSSNSNGVGGKNIYGIIYCQIRLRQQHKTVTFCIILLLSLLFSWPCL